MSSDISPAPTCFDIAAAAWSCSVVPQPLGLRITYRFIVSLPDLVSTIVRAWSIRTIVLSCQVNGGGPPQAPHRRRTKSQGDPARGGAARHGRGHQRALDRPARGGGRDEQERALRPLRLEGGAAAGADRDRARPLSRARDRARTGGDDGARSPAAADRAIPAARGEQGLSGRLL